MFATSPFSIKRVGLAVASATAALLVLAPSAGAATPEELEAARERVQALTQAISDAETDLASLQQAAADVQIRVGFRTAVPSDGAVAGDEAAGESGRSGSTTSGAVDPATRTAIVSGSSEVAAADLADRWVDAVPTEDTEAVVEAVALDDQADAEAARLALVRQLRDELEVELAQLNELEEEQAAAESMRAKADAAEITSDGGPLSSTRIEPSFEVGRLQYCPVAGTHSFINSWGFARSGGRRHQGVDMMAASGTPVVAPVDGVVSLRSNRVGGRSFHLEGDDGNYYYGTHMSAYGADGQVEAGTVIGYVGDDGNAAGINHLHFEVHPGGGSPVNPYDYVTEVC